MNYLRFSLPCVLFAVVLSTALGAADTSRTFTMQLFVKKVAEDGELSEGIRALAKTALQSFESIEFELKHFEGQARDVPSYVRTFWNAYTYHKNSIFEVDELRLVDMYPIRYSRMMTGLLKVDREIADYKQENAETDDAIRAIEAVNDKILVILWHVLDHSRQLFTFNYLLKAIKGVYSDETEVVDAITANLSLLRALIQQGGVDLTLPLLKTFMTTYHHPAYLSASSKGLKYYVKQYLKGTVRALERLEGVIPYESFFYENQTPQTKFNAELSELNQKIRALLLRVKARFQNHRAQSGRGRGRFRGRGRARGRGRGRGRGRYVRKG